MAHALHQRLATPRASCRINCRARQLQARCVAAAAPVQSKIENPVKNGLLRFVKYHGLGNDFILVDNRFNSNLVISPKQAKALCDRNFGVGGDGVIFAVPGSDGTDFGMRIINSDGSEPEMCGNGIRCLARFIADIDGQGSSQYRISTLAGVMVPELMDDGTVKVDMGPPILEGPKVPCTLPPTKGSTIVQQNLEVDGSTWQVTCVSMGNPHAVIYTKDNKGFKVDDLDLARIGPMFEHNPVFPARTNTEFVQVLNRSHVKMVVWERGAGRTLACGTGACALVVAGILEGRLEREAPVKVDLPGGPLRIEWRKSDDHILMTGPAQLVFAGTAKL